MVSRNAGVFAALVAGSLLFGLAAHTHARVIREVVILQTGLTSSTDAALIEDCKRFKPTVKQVRNFFLNAYPVPRHFGGHERYSPCYAKGSIVYEGFGKVDWTVTSGGVGSLIWSEDDIVDLFHKRNGWFDPAACTYGTGDKGAC